MRPLVALVLVASVVSPAVVAADDNARPPPARTTVGIDGSFVLPLGEYSDGGNEYAAGGLLHIAYAVTPEVGITLRSGYLWHETTFDNRGLGMIPVLLGGTYRHPSGAFAYGELGVNVVRASMTFMGSSATNDGAYVAYGGGAGYAFGRIEARLGIWVPARIDDISGQYTMVGVLGSIGVEVGAF